MNSFEAYQEKLRGNNKLSRYISEKEFISSRTAVANKIDNRFQFDYQKKNAIFLCNDYIDIVRVDCKSAIIVNSGLRVPKLNILVGGVSDSYHQDGLAIDFYVHGWDIKDVFKRILKLRKENKLSHIDQLICYENKKFIHFQVQSEYIVNMVSREEYYIVDKTGKYNRVYN